MSVFILVGAHKTATTHLTFCLEAIESQLMQAGVMFLAPKVLRHPPLEVRALLGGAGRRSARRATVSGILRGLIEDHRDLIIQDEQILGGLGGGRFLGAGGRIYPDAGLRLSSLLDLIGTRDVTVMLACRSPADFLTSAFGEALLQGGSLRMDEFLGDFDPTALRWSELAERLMAESGAARMVCWRYEDLAAIRGELLRSLLGEKLGAAVPNLPPKRRGLSDAAYRMLRAAAEGGVVPHGLTGQALRQLPKKGAADRMQVLPQAVHDVCERVYAEDCKRLAALPGVRFLSPGPVQA